MEFQHRHRGLSRSASTLCLNKDKYAILHNARDESRKLQSIVCSLKLASRADVVLVLREGAGVCQENRTQ